MLLVDEAAKNGVYMWCMLPVRIVDGWPAVEFFKCRGHTNQPTNQLRCSCELFVRE